MVNASLEEKKKNLKRAEEDINASHIIMLMEEEAKKADILLDDAFTKISRSKKSVGRISTKGMIWAKKSKLEHRF